MIEPIRVLLVEDSPDDAELTVRALQRGGFDSTYERVDTPEAMRAALAQETWDLVIADYSMPRFNGLAALKMLRESELDLPFILVSGAVGEDVAVEAMRCGADDYVLKSNLVRLPLAVERELRDYQVRIERNRAQARYRSLADRVPVGLFRISAEGDLLEFNPPLIEMLGFPEGSSPQRLNLEEVWLRQDERARLKAIIDREGVVKNFAMELRRPDGSVIWCEQTARAIYDATGEILHYEGVLVDITSRKRAEEEANHARDKVRDLALETARLRSEFLASMSHEIRTPLVGIIGSGELLSHSVLSFEQRRLIEIIRSSGELLLTVVNDILDFSKLAAGRVVLEKLDFDLVDVTEGLIDAFAAPARAKAIELALTSRSKFADRLEGRSEPAAPGPQQPGGQRDQVHGPGRCNRQGHARRRKCRRRVGAVRGRRHRNWNPVRGAGAPVSAVRAGGRIDQPALRRHRPRPGHRGQTAGTNGRRNRF